MPYFVFVINKFFLTAVLSHRPLVHDIKFYIDSRKARRSKNYPMRMPFFLTNTKDITNFSTIDIFYRNLLSTNQRCYRMYKAGTKMTFKTKIDQIF